MLKNVRSGSAVFRPPVPSQSWAQSHYAGYLSACESASVSRLETLTCGQLSLLRSLSTAWASKDSSIHRLIRQFESYFDPTTPTSLIYFVGLGGIELFVMILCDTDTVEFTVRGADRGLEVRMAVMRVLIELLVCHNDFGWYLYDQYPYLALRLVEFLHVDALRDMAIMLLEHMSSVVGPMLFLEDSPELQGLIRSLPDAGLAALTRVMALSVVTGIMSEGPWKSRPEPFPQCITRVQRTHDVSERNIRWLLDDANTTQPPDVARKNRIPSTAHGNTNRIDLGGSLLKRLLDMSVVTSSGVRIFQGGRSVTVVQNPPEVNAQVNAEMLQQLYAVMSALGQPMPTTVAPMAQPPQAAEAFLDEMMQGSEEGDEEDEWTSDEEPQAAAPPQAATLPQAAAQPAATPIDLATLQSLLSGGTATSTPGVWAASPLPQNGGGANAPPSLQTLATTLSEDLTPSNNLDSISFAWFVSRGNAKGRWRESAVLVTSRQQLGEAVTKGRQLGTSLLRRELYDFSRHPWSLHRSMRSPLEAKRQSQKFVNFHRDLHAREQQRLSSRHAEQAVISQMQSICNAQSEIFFLLNTFLASLHWASWRKLTEYNMFSMLVPAVVDHVFFLATDAPRTVFARTSAQRNGVINPSSSAGGDKYEPLANRPTVGREVFWSPPQDRRGSSAGTTATTTAAGDSDWSEEDPTTCRTSSNDSITTFLYHPTSTIAGASPPSVHNHHKKVVGNSALRSEMVEWCKPAELFARFNGNVDHSLFPKDELDSGHRHDPDTLRKLELVRTLFEYINVQDRQEHFQLMTVPHIAEKSQNMAEKLAKQLMEGTEDACTETLISHTLEAYCRGFGHFAQLGIEANMRHGSVFITSAGRFVKAKQCSQEVLGADLVSYLIEQRIYNAVRDLGHPNSLTPVKRVDGIFALLGELIKYNDHHLQTLQSYIMDQLIPDANVLTPTAPEGSREDPIPTGPFSIARAPAEPFLSVLQYRMLNFPCDTNLFLRALSLCLTPSMTCWRNYLHKLSSVDEQALRDGHLTVEAALDKMDDASKALHLFPHRMERSVSQLRRFFHIRKQSRLWVAQLCEMMGLHTAHHQPCRRWPEEIQRDVFVNIINQIRLNPFALPIEERPFPNLFGATDEEILRGGRLPAAGLPDEMKVSFLTRFGTAPPSTQKSYPELATSLLSEPWKLIYGMIASLNAEWIENTDRVCVITSSLSLFVRAFAIGGQSLVDDYLRLLMEHARERYVNRYEQLLELSAAHDKTEAAQRSFDGEHASPLRQNGSCEQECSVLPCSASTVLDVQCEHFVDCGDCTSTAGSPIAAYQHTHGRCFAKHFFRILCVWLLHYSSSQRYVETLYFCTFIPFAEWKVVALYIFRCLPRYFTHRSADAPIPRTNLGSS